MSWLENELPFEPLLFTIIANKYSIIIELYLYVIKSAEMVVTDLGYLLKYVY